VVHADLILEQCETTHRRVLAAGIICLSSTCKRVIPNGRIVITGGVNHGKSAKCGVEIICRVEKKRLETLSSVIGAGRVAVERLVSGGRVLEAGGVAEERIKTGGRVVVAIAVILKRFSAVRGVIAPVMNRSQCCTPSRRVVVARPPGNDTT